ncbi:MAG: histidine kinase, partial [Caulobacteraceae bacterium]|nr:histidine kinase [Caulobacteraceae bacterium]
MAAHSPLHPDGPLSLALAVVESSTAPLLLLDEALRVVAASTSFGLAFDCDSDHLAGRFLGEIGTGEWNRPQLRVLLEATAAGTADVRAYEMDLN